MSDRGDYRSFYTVFWDDEDVHRLPDGAYRVLTTLRGTLPASGIGFVYPVQLAVRCGKTVEEVEEALRILEQPKADGSLGWIMRERGVVWIVNALRFEPNLSWKNKKHRDFVRERHMAPIGSRVRLVAAIRAHYPEWFPIAEAGEPPTIPDTYRKPEISILESQDRVSSERISPALTTPTNTSPSQPSPTQPDVVVGDEVESDGDLSSEPATAVELAVAANLAVAERWFEHPSPYTASSATALERDLRERGIPGRIAEKSIWRQIRESKGAERPSHPNWLKPGIIGDWEKAVMRAKVASAAGAVPPRDIQSTPAPARQTAGDRSYAEADAAFAAMDAAVGGKTP